MSLAAVEAAPAAPDQLSHPHWGSRLDWEMLHLTSCFLEWGDQL